MKLYHTSDLSSRKNSVYVFHSKIHGLPFTSVYGVHSDYQFTASDRVGKAGYEANFYHVVHYVSIYAKICLADNTALYAHPCVCVHRACACACMCTCVCVRMYICISCVCVCVHACVCAGVHLLMPPPPPTISLRRKLTIDMKFKTIRKQVFSLKSFLPL